MKSQLPGVPPELSQHLAELRERPPVPRKEDIDSIVAEILHSLKGDLSEGSLKLYAELEGLAKYILAAKQEIAALRPDEIMEKHLPTATDELDAIIVATETATNSILNAMETLEGMALSMAPELAGQMTSAVNQVYEACNFQDLTGQRITKVVKALKHIEVKVGALVTAFGEEIERHKNFHRPSDPATEPAERSPANQGTAQVLSSAGPQRPSDAAKQEDIDALLASFD